MVVDDYWTVLNGKSGWVCFNCANFNYESRRKCNRCDKYRSPSIIGIKNYEFENLMRNMFIKKQQEEYNKRIKIETLKNDQERDLNKYKNSISQREGEWTCFKCSNENNSYNRSCFKCSSIKDGCSSSFHEVRSQESNTNYKLAKVNSNGSNQCFSSNKSKKVSGFSLKNINSTQSATKKPSLMVKQLQEANRNVKPMILSELEDEDTDYLNLIAQQLSILEADSSQI